MPFVEVAFPEPPYLGQTFSYEAPAGLELQTGDAVLAPSAHARLIGIVVRATERPSSTAR